MGKWLGAGLILAVAALILGWFFGGVKIKSMEDDIRTSLKRAGHGEYTTVNMTGNVATLTGEVPNKKIKSTIVNLAKRTKCSKCKGKRKWHVVNDEMTVGSLAKTQSPFTFQAKKIENGRVILSGYMPSEKDKALILQKASDIFGSDVVDRTIKIANGVPGPEFVDASQVYMRNLSFLDTGMFKQSDYEGKVTGTTSIASIARRIKTLGSKRLVGKYKTRFSTDIEVVGEAPDIEVEPASPEPTPKPDPKPKPKPKPKPDPKPKPKPVVETALDVCQKMIDDIKGENRVQFESGKALITGAQSFDLLNDLAKAAKKCDSFVIAVAGHTDSVGNPNFNQHLSQVRADTVKAYLIEIGISPSRMTATGYGASNPIADNSTREGRAKNRRITFTVTRAN